VRELGSAVHVDVAESADLSQLAEVSH
jgi:hypothetical protein